MEMLFAAHSGVRYLVLLIGLIALVWFAWGKAAGSPFARPAPALLAAFVGILDVQVLLGVALVIGGHRPPGIWGHVALMAAAVTFAHVMKKRGKRAEGYGLPLLGVAVALALIVVGILSIGRPIV
jgi:uncharacterized membrane protein YphA (DoxX/SURF4 family)